MAKYVGENSLAELVVKTKQLVATKQDALVSGTNIKTINNTSLLGSGNITISGGGGLSVNDLLTYVYPVGSIYMSTSNTSPASFLGGTWSKIKGRFLLSAGANTANTTNDYGSMSASTINRTAGEQGGEHKHTLTTNEMPAHAHHEVIDNYGNPFAYTLLGGGGDSVAGKFFNGVRNDYTGERVLTGSTGGGQTHNNMPPYLVVYMWKRTA